MQKLYVHSGHFAEYRPGIPSTLAVCLYKLYSALLEMDFVFMRFVIPVAFYEITNVECVYWSNTTIFVGRI